MNKIIRQLSALFHEYLPEDVVKATRSTEAFANEVYDIAVSDGQRYFLKILKEQLPEVIATEAQMQKQLLVAGVNTPEYLEIKPRQYVGEHNGTRFILSKYIPGTSPKTVTPALIENFGAILAKLHDSLKGVDIAPNIMQWLNLARVERDLAGYDGEAKDVLMQLVQTGKGVFELNLPTATIHGDLWMSNVFAKDDTITTVFDLETAENTVRLIDLARTYTSMRFNSAYSAAEIIESLTTGYSSVAKEPLTAKERDSFNLAIGYVSGACATWHAVHGTRYRDPYISFGKEALGL
jgi:Ser/Thr protein kinase RdoA (MazF antagonist)